MEVDFVFLELLSTEDHVFCAVVSSSKDKESVSHFSQSSSITYLA